MAQKLHYFILMPAMNFLAPSLKGDLSLIYNVKMINAGL